MKITKFFAAIFLFVALLSMNIISVYAIDYAFFDTKESESKSIVTSSPGKNSMSWYLQFEKAGMPPQTVDISHFAEDYGIIYRENCAKTGSKNVYLTFDVGYDDGNVSIILDALKKHGARGAFFVLPHFIEASPELISRINDEGHLICNHTTHHKDMSTVTDPEEFAAELSGVELLYNKSTGKQMAKFFRPPEGKFSETTLKLARDAGYKTVFWSLAYADWDKNKQPDPQKALGTLLSRVHDGSVILLHPTSSTNAAIMDTFLNELKLRGYTFARLDEFPTDNNLGEYADADDKNLSEVVGGSQ